MQEAKITGEYIKLDALLKYLNIAGSGGEAKLLIQEGNIFVNKEACIQRGRKIKRGDEVSVNGEIIRVK